MSCGPSAHLCLEVCNELLHMGGLQLEVAAVHAYCCLHGDAWLVDKLLQWGDGEGGSR